MERNRICCKVDCPDKFDCKMFQATMDYIAGKFTKYEIVECINHNFYEK